MEGKTHFRLYLQNNKNTPKSSYGFRLEITIHHTNQKDVQTSHLSTNHINTTIQCESSNIKMF